MARDAYRADQASIEKQKSWKSRVGELKEAQDNLRTTKEAFYRCALLRLSSCKIHLF